MLDRIDMERLFRVLHQWGYDHGEIYAESRHETWITCEDRLFATRIASNSGVSIRAENEQGVFHWSTNQTDNTLLIKSLEQVLNGNKNFSIQQTVETNDVPKPLVIPLEKITHALSSVVRTAWPENENIRLKILFYHDTVRAFEVAGMEGSIHGGIEQSATARASWSDRRFGKSLEGNAELWGTEISDFINEMIHKHPFRKKVLSLRKGANPWPVPDGELPILWSTQALSKLLLLFLHGFEGDLVLENISFLNHLLLPLQIPFTIFDRPNVKSMPFDHEGSPRKTVTIFDQGRPKALACNNTIASHFSVVSTGHCRRESYKNPPTVGFWNPVVQAQKTEPSLLSKIEKGIEADDIQVLSFDPFTADVHLRLVGARLIHHGEVGETIQPFDIQYNLIQLLSSFRSLSQHQDKLTVPIKKGNQHFLTEITSPAALSYPLLIHGEVPQSHYW